MSHILNYRNWNVINEQNSTGFSCDLAWYKGDELNINNFGNMLSCLPKKSAFEFWNSTNDNVKESILNTLKEGTEGLTEYGLATSQAAMKGVFKDNEKYRTKSYRIDQAVYNRIDRGDKPGTGGFYLDELNNIYIKNSIGDIQRGANNIVELISKLNAMNKARYINGEKQIKIGDAGTLSELKVDKGPNKGFAYELNEMTEYDGFIYYPQLPDPVRKIIQKKDSTRVDDIAPFNKKMPEYFKDNSIEPNNDFLNAVYAYFDDIFIKNKGTVTKLSIESGASNKRTTYPDPKESGTFSYKKNFKLAEDRGNNLYNILKKKYGDKIPAMTEPVKAVIQDCGGDGEAGICPIAANEDAKFLKINVAGTFETPIVEYITKNQISYTITMWDLKRMK